MFEKARQIQAKIIPRLEIALVGEDRYVIQAAWLWEQYFVYFPLELTVHLQYSNYIYMYVSRVYMDYLLRWCAPL